MLPGCCIRVIRKPDLPCYERGLGARRLWGRFKAVISAVRFPILLLGCLCLPVEAAAQGFLERLFGAPPRQAPQPPAPVPVPPAPVPVSPGTPPPAEGEAPGARPQPSGPPPPKPIVLKPVSEESVLNRELKLNGTVGSLRIERAGSGGLVARAAFQGTVVGKPEQSCTVKVGERDPVPLSSQGRPDGVPRFDLPIPACPLTLDVFEGAVHATGTATCVFEAASCQVEPRGLWGPEPGGLVQQASTLEQARGQADRAVRENYRALTQRAKPGEVRAIVTEQAAFSSDREQLCRSYAREGAHGFCNARFTEARALSLAGRLGILPPDQPPPAAGRPRRPPASAAINPPGGPPPSPESPASGSAPSGIR